MGQLSAPHSVGFIRRDPDQTRQAPKPFGPSSPPLGTFRSPSTCAPATPPDFGVKRPVYLAPSHQQPPCAPPHAETTRLGFCYVPIPARPTARPSPSPSTLPGQPTTLPGAVLLGTWTDHGRMGSRPGLSLCGGHRQVRGAGWNVPHSHGSALSVWV